MPHRRLPNYLRSHRKKSGLSQDELALLLGCRSGTKVSRYENCIRKPELETLLALELLFRKPASELFGGINDAVRFVTHRRINGLIKKLDQADASPEVS